MGREGHGGGGARGGGCKGKGGQLLCVLIVHYPKTSKKTSFNKFTI